MRKFLLVLLLAVVSNSALAGWVRIKNEFVPAYIDTDSVSKDGEIAKLSKLYDYKAAQMDSHGKLMRSMVIRYEYDCESRSVRTLDFISYAGNMGKGNVLSEIPNPNVSWQSVPADRTERSLFDFACGDR